MSKKFKSMSGTELSHKLLKSVCEMKAGKIAHATHVAANEVATTQRR